MPAPSHIRLQYTGTLGGGAEIFSFGVSAGLGSAGTTDPFISKDTLETARPSLWAPVGDLVPGMTSQAVLTGFKISLIRDDGKVAVGSDGAYVQAEGVYNIPGQATEKLPLQTALVISLQSVADGATGRGRFFLPVPTTGTLDNDGRINATVQSGHGTRALGFLNGLNTALAAQNLGPVVVASGGSAIRGVPAALRPVVSIRVGRVLDTQRRRRGDLSEDYSIRPLG